MPPLSQVQAVEILLEYQIPWANSRRYVRSLDRSHWRVASRGETYSEAQKYSTQQNAHFSTNSEKHCEKSHQKSRFKGRHSYQIQSFAW
jgi:hypothetical protein